MKYRVVLQVADITKECSATKEVGRVHFRPCGEPKIDNGRVTDGKEQTTQPFVLFLLDLERRGVLIPQILL
jgi:hypothetical protein